MSQKNNSTNDLLWKVKRLIKVIDNSFKSWAKRGNTPMLSDVADSVRSWKMDLEAMTPMAKSNTPSFYNAVRSMDSAWDNRDNRKSALHYIKESMENLKQIEGELENPEFKQFHTRMSGKALFGDVAERYNSDPSVFGDLWNIRSEINGLENANPQMIDRTHINRVKSMLADVMERYPYEDNPMNINARNASRHIDLAIRYKNHPYRFTEAMKAIGGIIDDMGAYADTQYSPESYQPEIDLGANSVKSALDSLINLTYKQPFESPSNLLREMVNTSRRVKGIVDTYNDAKAKRLASNILQDLQVAKQSSESRRVKSVGFGAWDMSEIREPYQSAMNNVAILDAYISNL